MMILLSLAILCFLYVVWLLWEMRKAQPVIHVHIITRKKRDDIDERMARAREIVYRREMNRRKCLSRVAKQRKRQQGRFA